MKELKKVMANDGFEGEIVDISNNKAIVYNRDKDIEKEYHIWELKEIK